MPDWLLIANFSVVPLFALACAVALVMLAAKGTITGGRATALAVVMVADILFLGGYEALKRLPELKALRHHSLEVDVGLRDRDALVDAIKAAGEAAKPAPAPAAAAPSGASDAALSALERRLLDLEKRLGASEAERDQSIDHVRTRGEHNTKMLDELRARSEKTGAEVEKLRQGIADFRGELSKILDQLKKGEGGSTEPR